MPEEKKGQIQPAPTPATRIAETVVPELQDGDWPIDFFLSPPGSSASLTRKLLFSLGALLGPSIAMQIALSIGPDRS